MCKGICIIEQLEKCYYAVYIKTSPDRNSSNIINVFRLKTMLRFYKVWFFKNAINTSRTKHTILMNLPQRKFKGTSAFFI